MAPSFVYYAQCRDTTRIKIGLSADPARRIAALNQGSSTLVELLCTEPGGRKVEQARHREFAAARVPHLTSREWFYPVTPLLNLITKRRGTPHPEPIVPESVGEWYRADLRAKVAESALREAQRVWEDVRRSLERVEPIHRLVYAIMRIRRGYHGARPYSSRDGLSRRAVSDADDLAVWLSPVVASSMASRDLGPDELVEMVAGATP